MMIKEGQEVRSLRGNEPTQVQEINGNWILLSNGHRISKDRFTENYQVSKQTSNISESYVNPQASQRVDQSLFQTQPIQSSGGSWLDDDGPIDPNKLFQSSYNALKSELQSEASSINTAALSDVPDGSSGVRFLTPQQESEPIAKDSEHMQASNMREVQLGEDSYQTVSNRPPKNFDKYGNPIGQQAQRKLPNINPDDYQYEDLDDEELAALEVDSSQITEQPLMAADDKVIKPTKKSQKRAESIQKKAHILQIEEPEVSPLLKSLKRNHKLELEIEFEHKIPSLDVLDALKDNVEVDIFEELAHEIAHEIASDTDSLAKTIAKKLKDIAKNEKTIGAKVKRGRGRPPGSKNKKSNVKHKSKNS